MRLNVPLVKQPSKLDCGPACATMLLRFLGIDVSTNQIKQIIKKQGRICAPQLALAIEKCLPDKLHFSFFNHEYFDESFNSLNKKAMIKYIESLKAVNKLDEGFIENLKKLIATTAKVEFKLITTKVIRNILSKGCPIITLVSVADFRKTKLAEWRGHFIVLTGYDGLFFYYNDPHWEKTRFGRHRIEQEHLLTSICGTRFPAIMWGQDAC